MAIANTTIRIKKSLVSGVTPSSLANGEIAINQADGKIFYATPSGSISYITNSQSFATVNANSSLVLATSPTDTLSIVPGNNITISACTATKTITISSVDGGSEKVFNYRQNTAPPTSNNVGDLWTNTDTGVVYENFGTAASPVWAETGPTGVQSNNAPGVFSATNVSTGIIYVNGVDLLSFSQQAFNKANNALANTGGTITGNLIVSGNTTINKQLFVNYTPSSTTNAAIEIIAANTKGGTGYADFLKFTNTSGGATYPNKTIRMNNSGNIEIIDSNYGNNIFNLSDVGDLTIKGSLITPNLPAFRVYGAGTTNISATNTLTSSNFAVDYNQGSYLNASTGIFTAPIAGLYQVNLIARFAGSASISAIQVQKTSGATVSTQVYIEWAGNSTSYHMGGASVVKMAVGDTLKTVVTSGTVTFDANDCWSVAYLG